MQVVSALIQQTAIFVYNLLYKRNFALNAHVAEVADAQV